MRYMLTAAAVALPLALTGTALAEGTKSDTRMQESSMQEQSMQDDSGMQAAGLSGENLSREEVRAIQQALNDAGQDIAVDGIWGDNTAQAVLRYQKDRGYTASGELDPQTVAALGVDLEAGATATQQAQTPQPKPETDEPAGMDQEDPMAAEPVAD